MFGLEKKKEKKDFAFDLEKEIHEEPKKAAELIKKAEKNIQHIKEKIRSGASAKELEDYGVLLHGYTALQKVLKKMSKK